MNFAKILAPFSVFQTQVLHTKANKIHSPEVCLSLCIFIFENKFLLCEHEFFLMFLS